MAEGGFGRRLNNCDGNRQNHPDDRNDFDLPDDDDVARPFHGGVRGGERHRPRGDRGRGRGGGHDGRGRGGRGQGGMHEERPDGQNRDQADGRGGGRGFQRGRGMGQRSGQIRRLNYKQLVDLKSKDASDIVMKLSSEQAAFADLLQSDMSPSTMKVMLHLLATACSTNSAKMHLFEIITVVEKSIFLKETVTAALTALTAKSDPEDARGDREFLKNLLTLLQYLSTSFPHSVVTISGLQDVLKLTIVELKDTVNNDVVDEEILEMMTDLDDLKGKMFTKIQANIEEKRMTVQPGAKPPDNFRVLSVFPTEQDIYPDKDGPYLRKNRAMGRYTDLNEYLDIQFRLLREDFICPLREGIDDYLQPKEVHGRRRIKDIRVYNDVRMLRTVCAWRGLLHRLEFDVSKLK
ncbi:NFX1-type zinc finger-containing protein 1-like [Gigantopelta aegis]|uniref:NFX1-type zinc finger-containing protein 1-like n=1 Tax=Gigantopelta aegis TaxID=1735272 RepID=UPI001B88CB33|nr:NFX1-type zinc finger-containing protein 1-like [Gigantopelta aegis]